MTPPPPPPSRTTHCTSSCNSKEATDLADEFDDINFFPGTSPTSNSHTLKPRLVKRNNSVTSALTSASLTSGNSSGSLANSNNSNFSFSDDFTLGSRTSNPSGHVNTAAPKIHSHHSHHSHHGHNNHSQSRRASYSHNHRSKERFVFSNFRFLVKESAPFPNSVDEAFDWLSIEMVLVPEIENVLCPICLDCPCVPRFTRCGHIYCLPCLLQFFQASDPSSVGNNWRSCPVCAEPLHLKQLRPVKFCPATEPQEGEIFHSLLIQKAVGSLRPHLPIFSNDSLSSLSPFQRLIPVSRTFVLNEIITPDINLLRSEIKNRKLFGEESLEMSFYEASIKLLEDQKKQEESVKNVIEPATVKQLHEHPVKQQPAAECYYFHQSRDGLNVFLHPLSMKILKHHFSSYDAIPRDLSLPIIQLERVLVNQSNRKRFKYLDHLSLGTQIILVEVDLRSIVSDSTLQTHSKELANRQGARDQILAKSSATPRDRSILEEWKMMEDDYYSITQASAAMDIRVPESVKLDNLDDEASFPLPSSFNSSAISAVPIKANPKKSVGSTVGSPSFSALAHSLNSPFTFSSSINFSNEALVSNSPPVSTVFNTANISATSPTQTPSWVVSPPTQTSTPTSTSDASSTTTSKKKIVLFSSGLNLKQR